MGILDIFTKGSSGGPLKKHAARAASKRAQAADRWESIKALGEMQSAEAVDALIARFGIRVDPSITDQEEKEATVDAIVSAGEVAIEPLRRFLQRTESIAWPLKCFERLLSDEQVVAELLGVLERMDTEYERDPEKKIQILSALEERRDERIIDSVRPFLDDVNETTRFHAVGTLFAQAPPGEDVPQADTVHELLLSMLEHEESVRIRARILDGLIERSWDVGERRDVIRERLPPGYALDGKGMARRSGG